MALISGSMYTDSKHQHKCATYSGDYSVSRSGNTVTFTLALTTNTYGGYGNPYANVKVYYNVTLNGQTQSATAQKESTGTSYYYITFNFPSASSVKASCYAGITKEGYDGYLDGTNSATGTYKVPAGGGYDITVTFNPGSGASVSPTSKVVANGSAIGDLPTPTYSGHDFNGWYDASSSQVTSSTVISGATSQVLYASWSVQQYSITANLDGGSGTFNTLTKVYGTNKQIWTNTPTKDKYIFQYWQDQQSTQYNPGAYYTKNYANVLTAIWKKANIPVYVKQNNTLHQIEKAYVKVNNQVKECTIYTKVGGQIKPIT